VLFRSVETAWAAFDENSMVESGPGPFDKNSMVESARALSTKADKSS